MQLKFVAASLYEAAVLALAEFRRCGFADATFGPRVPGSKSPNAKVEKERLKQWLGA